MYQVGNRVVYGIHGVCDVVEQEKQRVDRKLVTFLVLEPVGQEGSRFLVPTDNDIAMAKLSPMLTREELVSLLESAKAQEGWIADENRRKQLYRELIGSGDRGRLIGQVRTLYRHKHDLAATGKRCHLCDDNFLRDAERLLANEIAIVLGIDQDQAKSYLREKLNEDA